MTAATEARGLALFTLDDNGTPLEPHYCVTFRKGSDVPNRLLSYADLEDAATMARGIGIGAVCNGGRVLVQRVTDAGNVELDITNAKGTPCYVVAEACRCPEGYEAAR